MLGRTKRASLQSNGEFLASLKSYHEDQIIRKRLSNDSSLNTVTTRDRRSLSKERELNISLSQLENDDIEQSAYNDLMFRLSSNKAKSKTPESPVSSLSIKSPVFPTRQPIKHSITGQKQSIPDIKSTIKHNQNSTIYQQTVFPEPDVQNSTNLFQTKTKISQPVVSKNEPSFDSFSLSPPTKRNSTSQSNQVNQQPSIFNSFGGLSFGSPVKLNINQQTTVSNPLSIINSTPISTKSSIPLKTQAPTILNSTPIFNTQPLSNIITLKPTVSVQPQIVEEKKVDLNQKLVFGQNQDPIDSSNFGNLSTSTSQNTSNNQDSIDSLNFENLSTSLSTSPPKINKPVRHRRPSKSETPESSKFSYWVKSILKSYAEYISKLDDFKKNSAILPLCHKVRMAIQEIIDVHTMDDTTDISSISAALIFFQDLYRTGAAKIGEQPIPLTPDGKLFITMGICERYLKRVVGQDTCIPFVATLFIVLSKNEPDLFNILLSMIFSKCVLPRLDTNQCLEQVLKISEGPAEESAQWISDESSQFRLLIKVCSLTSNKNQDPMSGQNLIQFLLNEALRAPAIPISTPFAINAILSTTDMSNYQKRFPVEFSEILRKAKEICELNWPTIIRTTLDATEIRFTKRAITLMTAKNSALIQGLKATLSTFKI